MIKFISLTSIIITLLFCSGCDNEPTTKHEHSSKKPASIAPSKPLDFSLINHNGEQIDIKSLRGRPLFVVFFYTRCLDRDMCPLTIQRTMALQNKVEEEYPEKIRFLYITIDADNDTPETLKQYAQKKGINLERSDLLTGDPKEIKSIAMEQFYFAYERQTEKEFGHQMISYLINKDGILDGYVRWGKWSHEDIMRQLGDLL